MSGEGKADDPHFAQRRDEARDTIRQMDHDHDHDRASRQDFFNAVYERASGDAANVPWADLKPKEQLKQWLVQNSGINSSQALRAVDVACGLGDNAEALAGVGYETTGFDLAGDAIEWAKKRFPQSSVTYCKADLFDLPEDWIGAFDLAHECYTLQALPPDMLEKTAGAIASLVKPGGTLLVFTRTRPDGVNADGPPWPLEESRLAIFAKLGFSLIDDHRFENQRADRTIPHAFMQWRKNED